MTESSPLQLNPQLKDLEFLLGKWEMGLSNAAFLPQPSDTLKGRVTFEWMENGAFLLMRMGTDATWLMSRDEDQPSYTVLYFDARAVSRVYAMTFSRKVWTMWRESEHFSQRFTGRVSADERTITGEWTKRSNPQEWEHDFDVTYRRE